MHVDALSRQTDASKQGRDGDRTRKGRATAASPAHDDAPSLADEVLLSEAARLLAATRAGIPSPEPAAPGQRVPAGIETRAADGTYRVRTRTPPPTPQSSQ